MANVAEPTTTSQIGDKQIISKEPLTTYTERMIGKTLYRITSVYLGKFNLKNALEELAFCIAIQEMRRQTQSDTSDS